MEEKLHFKTEAEYLNYVNHLPKVQDGIKFKNFTRVQIVNPDGTVFGDSGYTGPNTIVNLGFNQYVVMSQGSIAGSKYITHAGLGTGAGPAVTDTALGSEVGTRTAVTCATSSGSKTLRITCTFAAGWHTSASAYNISSIGLYNTLSGGTIFAGNTYASSSCASNQAVNWRRLVAILVGKIREFGEHLFETIPSQQNALAFGRV